MRQLSSDVTPLPQVELQLPQQRCSPVEITSGYIISLLPLVDDPSVTEPRRQLLRAMEEAWFHHQHQENEAAKHTGLKRAHEQAASRATELGAPFLRKALALGKAVAELDWVDSLETDVSSVSSGTGGPAKKKQKLV